MLNAERGEPEDGASLVARLEQELDVVRDQRDAARRRVRELEVSVDYRIGMKARSVFGSVLKIRHKLKTPRLAPGAAKPDSSRGARTLNEAPKPTPFRREIGGAPPARVATPDVTVVIPAYNSESWLEDCLSSVLAQTGVNLELVCINDGSTDGTGDVLAGFAALDSRVTVIDQPNQGQSVGRNAGLDVATGRYVVFLDSDDFWPENTLSDLVRRADEQKLDVLLFDCQAFLDGAVEPGTWKRYSTYYQRSRSYDAVRNGAQMVADMRRNRDYRPHVGMYLARRVLVQDHGIRFIPGIIHQDNPYTFALLLNAERVAHTGSEIYARRIRPGSTITTLQDTKSVTGYFLSYVAMVRELHGRYFPEDVTRMLADVVYGVFDGASKKIASLTSAELAALEEADPTPEAQLALRALMRFRR